MMNHEKQTGDFRTRIESIIGGMKPFAWAKKIGLPGATFSRMWNEGTPPKWNYLVLISEKTNTSIDWLLTGEGPKTKSEPVDAVTPTAAHPHDDNLGLGESVELLAKIYNSGDQVLIRAIAANLLAFGTAINDRARADQAVNLMGRMEERITALEKRLETEKEELKRAASGS